VKAVYTTCPFCSCACGLYLQSDDGRLLGTAPSERHPVSHGRLCARGWHAHEAPLWGERLTQPLVRQEGELCPVSWPEAIRCAAEQLKAAQADGGVGVIGSARATNEESYLAARLARGALKTPHVDCGLRDTYWPLHTGIAQGLGGALQGTLDEIAACDLLLVEEGDLARTHPQVAAGVVRALRQGARLLTWGPVRTQLARLATLHVPTPPGCHGELAAALLTAVAEADESAPAPQVVQFLASARAAGVPDPGDELRQVARWYLEAWGAAMLLAPVSAPPEEMRAAAYAWALVARAAGHARRPGSLVLPLPVRGNLAGACRMGMAPDALPGGHDLADGAARERLARVWATEPAYDEGLRAADMLARLGGLLVVAEELATSMPKPPGTDALGRLKALVVLDAFATPTALAASIVLPITSLAETDGTAINLEGRVQHVQAAVPPAGEARPGWEVLAELASELGLADHRYASVADVGAEIARCVPGLDVRGESALASIDAPEASMGNPGWAAAANKPNPRYPFTLAVDGVMDWGEDPLVAFSPTLRRDSLAEAKRFPRGAVYLNKADADAIGIRAMAPVSIASATAAVVLPAVVRSDLERSLVLVPFAHRAQVAELLGSEAAVAVQLTRA